MLKMAKSELLDFYTAWQTAEEEQAESLKRVATQVEHCPSSSHYEKPKGKKKNPPQPLKMVNVKIHDDGHDNVSPLEMISMKAAPGDDIDVPPDPCSPTEPTSEDEKQNSKWYKDMGGLNDALLSSSSLKPWKREKTFSKPRLQRPWQKGLACNKVRLSWQKPLAIPSSSRATWKKC